MKVLARRSVYLAVVACGITLFLHPMLTAAGPSDLERLQGSWQFLSYEIGAVNASADDLSCATFVVQGDQLNGGNRGQSRREGTIRLASSKRPAWIDLVPDDGETQLGIYRFDGAELVICLSQGRERPIAFDAGLGKDANVLIRLAREPN